MNAAILPPHLRTLAPILAVRLGVILVSLAAVVAHGFLRNPRFVSLTVPLWNQINRTARRFSRLMDHLAAGRLPRHRAGSPGRHSAGSRAPKPSIPAPRIPTGNSWLVAALGYHAAGIGSQLDHLLNEPAMAELLAASPAAMRILKPIRRALGLIPRAPRRQPTPPPAAPHVRATPADPPRAAPPPAGMPPSRGAPTFGGPTFGGPTFVGADHDPPPRRPMVVCERMLKRWPYNQLPPGSYTVLLA